MRLRWWPHTTDAGVASTRLRCLRVLSALRAEGLDTGLYARGDPAPDLLVLAKRYDPASLSQALDLRASGSKLVLDLCDNHFHCDPPTAAWQRRADALRAAVRSVDAVTVATAALARVLHDECSPSLPPVHVIGDAAETALPAGDRWRHPFDEWALSRLQRQVEADRAQAGVQLLWFGNHGSDNAEAGMRDLLRIGEPLRALAARRRIGLTVISNHRRKFGSVVAALGIRCRYLPWRAGTFSRAAALHDIALLPIGLNPFTACKTNNRVTTALTHGLAVIADPIDSYLEFADSVALGDWATHLPALADDAPRRRDMVARGRRRIEQSWQLPTIVAQWRQTLTAVASMPAA